MYGMGDDLGEMGYFDGNGGLAGLGMPWGPVIDSGIPGDAAGMGQLTPAEAQLEIERIRAQERADQRAAEERSRLATQNLISNLVSETSKAASIAVPAAIAARSGQTLQLPVRGEVQQDQGSGGFSKVLPWVAGGAAVVGLAWFLLRNRGAKGA